MWKEVKLYETYHTMAQALSVYECAMGESVDEMLLQGLHDSRRLLKEINMPLEWRVLLEDNSMHPFSLSDDALSALETIVDLLPEYVSLLSLRSAARPRQGQTSYARSDPYDMLPLPPQPDEECPICYHLLSEPSDHDTADDPVGAEYLIVVANCRYRRPRIGPHRFHKLCLDEWIRESQRPIPSCPVCMLDLIGRSWTTVANDIGRVARLHVDRHLEVLKNEDFQRDVVHIGGATFLTNMTSALSRQLIRMDVVGLEGYQLLQNINMAVYVVFLSLVVARMYRNAY